jgi:hypothetical protein
MRHRHGLSRDINRPRPWSIMKCMREECTATTPPNESLYRRRWTRVVHQGIRAHCIRPLARRQQKRHQRVARCQCPSHPRRPGMAQPPRGDAGFVAEAVQRKKITTEVWNRRSWGHGQPCPRRDALSLSSPQRARLGGGAVAAHANLEDIDHPVDHSPSILRLTVVHRYRIAIIPVGHAGGPGQARHNRVA